MTSLRRDGPALAALFGGLLALLAAIPPAWYGSRPRQSYLFDPPAFSPLWIERELMPVLAVLAALGLLVGLAALVWRDRERSGWLWGTGVAAVLGASLFTISLFGLTVARGDTAAPDPYSSIAWLLPGLLGGLLLVVGLVLLGAVYLRRGRSRLGGVLVAVGPATIGVGVLLPEPVAGVASAGALAVLGVALSVELHRGWPERGDD
ncbi:hypothetical protein [Halodesulfurarchaeum formicicum]|uniref:DUF998 domain-containing protein n=1 Tax=Halodesulfurarchaeum formicicum TaxID=1873524 RepID=A0A1J1AB08_9EURY|nr:hypothetical protein [Halodesulfurarchaeum formicicum]APE94971.1 hypothetical protein HSR6_0509 [Halodesulfurarchaeum formicicum]